MDETGIEFLFWAECPSWERALALLRDRVAAAGRDPESIEVTELTTEDQAAGLGFPGSPTIRIGGDDVQEPAGLPIGLSCRVYRRPDGRVSPLPDSADIDAALAHAAGEGSR